MSPEYRVTCDRCGYSTTNDHEIQQFHLLDTENVSGKENMHADLCPRCSAALREWLNGEQR